MIVNIFTVHDSKAHAYLPPFYFLHDGQAVRTFQDCINSEKHQFHHHPADYTLYRIGTFDDEGASIDNIAPFSLGNGVEFVLTAAEREKQNEQVSDGTHLQQDTPSGHSAEQLRQEPRV